MDFSVQGDCREQGMAPVLRAQGSWICGRGKGFYANMVGMKDNTVYVKGKWISFERGQIDQTYNLQERKQGSKFKKLVEALDFQKIVNLLTDGKGKWNATIKNPHESITRGALVEPAKVWYYSYVQSFCLQNTYV